MAVPGDMDDRAISSAKLRDEEDAVQFAGNTYYGVSQRHHREFGGGVFRRMDSSWGVSVRKGQLRHTNMKYVEQDVPPNASLEATWHTHVLARGEKKGTFAKAELNNFSDGDLVHVRWRALLEAVKQRTVVQASVLRAASWRFYLISDTYIHLCLATFLPKGNEYFDPRLDPEAHITKHEEKFKLDYVKEILRRRAVH